MVSRMITIRKSSGEMPAWRNATNFAIDKYMGDAIVAFWNAPLDDKEHQLNACEAALDMLERIEGLNEVRELEAKEGGHPYFPINVGVGLNTGTCVVGNMGSDLRSTIPCSATASTLHRGWKDNPRSMASRSSSAPTPRSRSRTSLPSSSWILSWSKARKSPRSSMPLPGARIPRTPAASSACAI